MEIFNRMFAEKILLFHEGTNRWIRILMGLPVIGSHVSEKIFDKEQSRVRMAIGTVAQIVRMLGEFILKFIYVTVFLYIPYILLAKMYPLIASHQELTMIYMFVMFSVICGSLANNTMLALGDRDYLMIRVMLISPYMNFLGRLSYKMATDFIYFTIILCFYKVSLMNSIFLGIVTICARPIGEMFAIISFDHIKRLYYSRGFFKGLVMAICVLLAYLVPLLTGKVLPGWILVVHPVFVMLVVAAGALAMYYLWDYPNYRVIMRAAMHIKKED